MSREKTKIEEGDAEPRCRIHVDRELDMQPVSTNTVSSDSAWKENHDRAVKAMEMLRNQQDKQE